VGDFPPLVATDLDGTIVRRDGTISARTVAAFARVEAAGARFVLVTGRPPRVMGDIAALFGHVGTAICANGALAYDMRTDMVTTRHLIPAPVVADAIAALRTAVPGIGIALEYPDGRAADEAFQAINWDINQTMPRPGDAALFARPASKLLGRHLGYGCDDLLALALPAIGDLVSVTHSNGKGLIEASALGVSKASVVAEIAADFGIGRESVLAFGDMPNDLPLLTWAGTSCAVANAHPDVLAAATHVIGSVDEDGVAEYLERVYPSLACAWGCRWGREAAWPLGLRGPLGREAASCCYPRPLGPIGRRWTVAYTGMYATVHHHAERLGDEPLPAVISGSARRAE
jgi:HAD superfamily hydrolase (TIGR01484 family)